MDIETKQPKWNKQNEENFLFSHKRTGCWWILKTKEKEMPHATRAKQNTPNEIGACMVNRLNRSNIMNESIEEPNKNDAKDEEPTEDQNVPNATYSITPKTNLLPKTSPKANAETKTTNKDTTN